MARLSYPFIPATLLTLPVRSRFDSLAKISSVHAPVMILHGDMDDTVPIEIARRLYDAANEPKRFYTIEGAGHNDTYGRRRRGILRRSQDVHRRSARRLLTTRQPRS